MTSRPPPLRTALRDRPDGGGPPVLPRWLDAASERWWSCGPRTRAVALGVAVALLVALAGARGLSAPYGPARDVLVAAVDLPAGTALATTDGLRRARWPADLVPPGATTDATGVLRGPLPAGSVLTDVHVTADGIGALAGTGRAAVPLPPETLPPVAAGDRLLVIAADADGTAHTLAGAAEVLATDAEAVWLAVDRDAVAGVAAAGLRGTIAVAVLPP